LKAIIFTLGKISKEKNIAHRDIKPGNIFVIQDDWLLGDFGEAYWHHAHLKAVQ
jgi:serine/threonine protein kinase